MQRGLNFILSPIKSSLVFQGKGLDFHLQIFTSKTIVGFGEVCILFCKTSPSLLFIGLTGVVHKSFQEVLRGLISLSLFSASLLLTHTFYSKCITKYFFVKKINSRSSRYGATGSVASSECWDSGSIPGPTRLGGLKIWPCCSCRLGHNSSSDLISGPGTPYAAGQPKK